MKSLLFTGASGFLGSNVLPQIKENYVVDTLDMSALSTYTVDLAEQIPKLLKQYDVILHAMGKAHSIPKSEKEEKSFYDINYKGTKNLCMAFEKGNIPRSMVFISTVAVYGCEFGEKITENYPLEADTAYGKSKIMAEEYLLEWCIRKNISLTILRPALLAGRNPTGNLGEMINGIAAGKYFCIAGGNARKSIAMADDIARIVPLCEDKSGIFNFCDDYNPSFRELEELISKQLNKPLPIKIPIWAAKYLAKIGDLFGLSVINNIKLSKIIHSLTFSNEKLKNELKFTPSNVLSNFFIC